MTPGIVGKAGEIEETLSGVSRNNSQSHNAELGHQGAAVLSSFQRQLWEFKVPAVSEPAHGLPRTPPLSHVMEDDLLWT